MGDDPFTGMVASKAERKERQLCRQAHEALSEALATLNDSILLEVWVAAVEPAPDGSRLAVIVQAPRGAPLDEVKERLERVAGYLRSEVASAIHRKRAPTLVFQVMPP
ncbi:ribosome-binding factor A [Chondromyces crocatus]|uniref:Ribosome-binding factor A n=1 Tax=Chondromyces crocatus TaxID=52 RepID=A0A0K1EC62_CHOCO|nr:ribosome-binding factor A [Chondromyces crocatus]AKT38460.1 uncharacterized protein CMC5_026070 [Chondromyces crocatus]